MTSIYSTIRYETGPDRVATITLDRPEVLNAFDRRMCGEIRDVWQRVKLDPQVHAVVLRAAGDRAFCAGLDVKKPYGQPEDVWNHEDPGELLSPKWQKCWKPVVCAVQGICTAGAFYFLNEADVVICSSDATFFDSHVTHGRVCAVEPIGLMRKIGLAETLRIALSGNDERVSAETALRIGLVTEVVDRPRLWERAHEIAAGIARKPSAATQGTVRAIWESLDRPYRAAMEQALIYTRLGNPLGMAQAQAEVDAGEQAAGSTGGAGTARATPNGSPTAGRPWRLR
ncbi:enoyl-CoA hydratase [Parafrankia colletiae]|uniref:Enoyl-CoA hydratase n=1 Tax=Parafrankia colletiae TaxID=573497 RepID=A0A1S1R3A8_9ACTN|nr:enoyl-CoA hydratase/isomerase family protein [Parafrankia colletiae]MCK9900208.1 enoyl-CoA hydratase/isomerase family protein [Frankia sp. Cpl3]OHV40259.1 enoyl-CoA hydratase [Parafrankia colletiae]